MNDNARLRVTLSIRTKYGSGTAGQDAVLEIRDVPSSQAVASVTLRPEQLVGLLAGTVLEVDGWLVPELLRYRLGRKMQNEIVVVPPEVVPKWKTRLDDEARDRIASWAEDHARSEGWDDYDAPRANNQGEVIVVFRRWPEPDRHLLPKPKGSK